MQALFTAGISANGDACEIALATHSLWPTHRGAMQEERFRVPVEFLSGVGQRIIDTSRPVHGDVLDRDHPLVGGIEWPGDFKQWLVVEHESVKSCAAVSEGKCPKLLFLVPHLEKKALKRGPDARARADFKATVKWEKPALKGGKNNLVIPLCYNAPWLSDFKDVL